jgi:pimeloyl-ACP methyl ester carboxylesterase
MTDERIHRAVSDDGTEIAGRMEGHGPPLVLLPPVIVEAAIAWKALLPHLTDWLTCYLPDVRGRGLSGDSPDQSPQRFQEDIIAFVASIDEPVCLMGWSDGGSMAFSAAAARSDSVAAVVAYEPSVYPLLGEDELARIGVVLENVFAAAADGRLVEATRIFHRYVCNDNEYDALDTAYLERQGSIWPLRMREVQQGTPFQGSQPTDPEVLGQVDVPTLILLGQQTRLDTWFTDSAQHVADAHVRELPGVGHCAPLVAPKLVADELIAFFEAVGQPA